MTELIVRFHTRIPCLAFHPVEAFEFLGAVTMGRFVSAEISRGILDADDYVGDDQVRTSVQPYESAAPLAACVLFTHSLTYYQPVDSCCVLKIALSRIT